MACVRVGRLIEVNASPSLSRENELDHAIKNTCIQDTIRLVDAPAFDRKIIVRRSIPCSMLYAQCSIIYAPCFMPNALLSMLHALCPMLYYLCSMLYAQCSIIYAPCFVLHAAAAMPRADIHPTLCSVKSSTRNWAKRPRVAGTRTRSLRANCTRPSAEFLPGRSGRCRGTSGATRGAPLDRSGMQSANSTRR
jgi:hypothetical protein